MKNCTILIALILAYTLTSGQVISTNVIAFASDCYLCQGYSLSCTLGETVNEAFLKGKDQITRELEYSYLSKISQLPVQLLPSEYSIRVSPDPTRPYFIVSIDADQECWLAKMMFYEMFDIKVDETILDVHDKVISVLLDEIQSLGEHSLEFDLSDQPHGLYLSRLQAESSVVTSKIIMLK